MHAMITRRSWAAAGATAVATLLLIPGPAHADKSPGTGSQGSVSAGGGRQGQEITSVIRYSGAIAGKGGKGGGAMKPVGDWTPPACWYEPRTAEQFRDQVERSYEETVNMPGQHSYAKRAVGEFRDKYKDGEYKDYNLKEKDKGAWWVAVRDPDREFEDAAQACDKQPFWVEDGDRPPVDNALSPELLAQLAYARMRLPDTEVSLAPEGTTKVNLPTWAWLDKARFKPLSATASVDLPGLNLSATTTARPGSLRLDPGTKDARTFPASGACAKNADGSVGEPYAKGKGDRTPPCGVTYLRSSGEGTYDLRATVTWNVSWDGAGTGGGALPDGEFGGEQPVRVEEIQAVNR
ncbi:hypothetical protein GCM10018785_32640 [Streptomyces longispororuber]|uniref:Secreted protein n=2 Tax=Streptomyces longispororuber TaxID=68230 RepID=A0A918ZMT4_9ACTN|nr:hypothetical protein GCM10018785_32640 [Streptomyces longispororuber]